MARALYELLGVEDDATEKQIKKAFRKKARYYHPDNAETGDEEQFLEVNKAYRILMDPDSRTLYDATGSTDDDTFKTADELNLKVLIEAFDQALAGCEDKLDESNLIEAMKIGMRESANSLHQSVAKSTAIRDQLVRFRRRMVVRGHRKNVFLTSIDRQIQGRNKEIAHNGRAVRILELNLEELSYYNSPIDLMFAYGMPRDQPARSRFGGFLGYSDPSA